MQQITLSVEQLRGMIGLRVRYRGSDYQVIEVLEDGPELVLSDLRGSGEVQNDLHGQAHRLAPRTECVPVLNTARDGLHQEFLALELLD